jgi:amino acid transporter
MSTMPVPVRRHALGLPAGSVRAAHVSGIVAIVCAIVLIPPKSPESVVAIPPYLVYLLFLMLGHYFASHGVTIATREDPSPSPLFLPGGVVRFLIVVALVGTFGWKLYSDPIGLREQFKASLDALEKQPELPVIILAGFFLGIIVRAVVGRTSPPAALQDFEAWISLIALIGICIAGIIHIIINPSLESDLYMPVWEGSVGGVIAFYFGERS